MTEYDLKITPGRTHTALRSSYAQALSLAITHVTQGLQYFDGRNVSLMDAVDQERVAELWFQRNRLQGLRDASDVGTATPDRIAPYFIGGKMYQWTLGGPK